MSVLVIEAMIGVSNNTFDWRFLKRLFFLGFFFKIKTKSLKFNSRGFPITVTLQDVIVPFYHR